MATQTRIIGPISAYAIAKSKGYTGTEEQFATEMGNASVNAQTASAAAAECRQIAGNLPSDFTEIIGELEYEMESSRAEGDDIYTTPLVIGMYSSTNGNTQDSTYICRKPVPTMDCIIKNTNSNYRIKLYYYKADGTFISSPAEYFNEVVPSIQAAKHEWMTDEENKAASVKMILRAWNDATDTIIPAADAPTLDDAAVAVLNNGLVFTAYPSAGQSTSGLKADNAKAFRICGNGEFLGTGGWQWGSVNVGNNGDRLGGDVWGTDQWTPGDQRNFRTSQTVMHAYLSCNPGDTVRVFTAGGNSAVIKAVAFVDSNGYVLRNVGNSVNSLTDGEINITAPENAAYVYANLKVDAIPPENAYMFVYKSTQRTRYNRLYADKNYTAGTVFAIADTLYKADSNIQQNAALNIGANCHITTVADELNALWAAINS